MILLYGLVTLPLYLARLTLLGFERFVLAEDLGRAMQELEENRDLVGVVFEWEMERLKGDDWEAFLALARQKNLPIIVLTEGVGPFVPTQLREFVIHINAARELTQAIIQMAGGGLG